MVRWGQRRALDPHNHGSSNSFVAEGLADGSELWVIGAAPIDLDDWLRIGTPTLIEAQRDY